MLRSHPPATAGGTDLIQVHPFTLRQTSHTRKGAKKNKSIFAPLFEMEQKFTAAMQPVRQRVSPIPANCSMPRRLKPAQLAPVAT